MNSCINEIADDRLFEWMKEIRRSLHLWPETAFEEFRTSSLIKERLDELGLEYRSNVAGTGVVGRLITDRNAPTAALRADMDALRIFENTGLPFSSQADGTMHACGHDGHVAMILGAAAILKKTPPNGNVVFIFQPAEEGVGGAKPMVEQGALEGVDVIFGGHIETEYDTGTIAIKRGIHTAYTDVLEINITGHGGHAARPHEARDAIVLASQLILHLQTIISRHLDPVQPSLITIGMLQAGTAHNAIAEKAILKGAVRTTDKDTRMRLIEQIKKTASSLASLYDSVIDVDIEPGYPPVINHERESDFAMHMAGKLFGEENVISLQSPVLGGEDFSYFTNEIPGCFVRLGAAKGPDDRPEAHSSSFDFDEEVLRVGSVYFSELVRYSLDKLNVA